MSADSKSFASDNFSGVHPRVMEAIVQANTGHAMAYGGDDLTEKARKALRRVFGQETDGYFVFNGTGANVSALAALTRPYNAIVCADVSHLQIHECGAPEKFTGCKLLPLPAKNGKISLQTLEEHLEGFGDPHHSQPGVLSITQPTELGTLYHPGEIVDLARRVHDQGMLLHVDGARLANAAAALKCELRETSFDCGVDALSLGGTKNGLMYGEAVLFRNRRLSSDYEFFRKQNTQLASKMRYIAVQFMEYLKTDLWKENAAHANGMAQKLAREVRKIRGVKVTRPVVTNAVFAKLPSKIIPALQQHYFFWVWDHGESEVRWMCSFDTTEEDIHGFCGKLRELL